MKLKHIRVYATAAAVMLTMSSITACSGKGAKEAIESTIESISYTEAVSEASSYTVKVTAINGNEITADTGSIEENAGGPGKGNPPSGDKPEGDSSSGDKPEGGAPSGDKPEGEAPSGDKPEGNPPSGDMPEGNPPSGDKPEGNPPSGDKPEGNPPSGNKPEGNPPSGDKPEGNPPSGDKPEGNPPSGDKPEGNPPSGDKPEGGAPGGDKPEGGAPGGQSTFSPDGDNIVFKVDDATKITVEFLQGSSEGSLDDISVGSVLEIELNSSNIATTITVKNLSAGGGFGGSGEVTQGTAKATIDTDSNETGTTYTSSGDDENALRIDGAAATLDSITVEKTGGESSNTEDGDFYGQNAALLATNKATANITNATITTNAINGNGVFSYGEGTTVNISDSTIRTTQRNSGGIQTTGGGTTNATNLDIQTEGNSSAAIRSDRGGGTVNVSKGSYVTNGTGSPAIYSTADISVSDATLTANNSEAVVIEGKNSVSLKDCTVTGNMKNTYNGDSTENIHAIMIYQSMSGDAALGEASFSAEGGSIKALAGDMFYITNTDCTMSLKNVAFTLANDTFLRIEGNSSSRGWGTEGSNGGDVTLSCDTEAIKGNILVDEISSLKLTLSNNSSLEGAINPDGEAGDVSLTLDKSSKLILTADSYVTSFDGDVSNIVSNGYKLYVSGKAIN